MSTTITWYRGVCDELLAILEQWERYYESGVPSADADFLTHQGRVTKVPTKYAHRVSFRKPHLEQLIRILTALRPQSTQLVDFKKVLAAFDRTTLSTGGWRQFLLDFYFIEVQELVKAVQEARDGGPASKLDWIKSNAQ